jgi:hypothetical protein
MNSRQSHIVVAAAIIIAICAVFTAFNTFALVATAAEQKGEEAAKAQVSEQDEIVQVIGRVDGLGAESGFLVTDGTRFKLVAYNPGSMASTSEYRPQFIKLVKLRSGETVIASIKLEQFR